MDNMHTEWHSNEMALIAYGKPDSCRSTCRERCSAVRDSLLQMLGVSQENYSVDNHQLQDIIYQQALRQLEPLHAGIRAVASGSNCCGGDGILALSDAQKMKTIVLADINGHGAREHAPLRQLFAIITKTASRHSALFDVWQHVNLEFAKWRESLEEQDEPHVPYAECAFLRMNAEGMTEALVAGGTTAMVLDTDGSTRQLCTEDAHTTWIGFPFVKKQIMPTRFQLERKQTLVLCTDGIDPAICSAHEFWHARASAHPDTLANDIFQTFCTKNDDATVLCLQR